MVPAVSWGLIAANTTLNWSVMLPWSWVTWAVRFCCLNFKCSQPDSSFPYCDGSGEGFQRPVSSILHLWRALQIRAFARFWKSLQEKRYFPTNSSLLRLTLIHISLAPLCLVAAAPTLSKGSAAGIPALSHSCWTPQSAVSCPLQHHIAPTLSVGISPGAVLAEAWGFGLERLFYMMFSIVH